MYASFLRDEAPVIKTLEYSKTLSPSKQRELSTELALAMEEQIGYERRFEKSKQELALRFDFNLLDGFRIFDYTDKGFISLPEFYDGMRELGVAGTYSEISQLFKRLDSDMDGRVRYSDYRTMFAPKNKEYEFMMLGRRLYTTPSLRRPILTFTSQTSTFYRDALEIALSHERALEGIRQRLKRNVFFNIYDAYDVLDIQGKGQVSISGSLIAVMP